MVEWGSDCRRYELYHLLANSIAPLPVPIAMSYATGWEQRGKRLSICFHTDSGKNDLQRQE